MTIRSAISRYATAMLVLVAACDSKSAEQKGIEAANEAAAKEHADQKAKAGSAVPVRTTPVPEGKHVPCEALLPDVAKFTTALEEKEPLVLRDDIAKDGNAAAACSLIRGGKKLTKPEMDARLKKEPRLGVLPGDPLCMITAYCWAFESPEHFRQTCATNKETEDDTMGSPACMHIIPTGIDDVQVFRFYDEDSKCVLKASSGGPNVNNDQIRTCAKLARDMIGAEQIKAFK